MAFLDVLVHRTLTGFLTSVYRKPTFAGLYTRWDSFCPTKRKINIIKTLLHRALKICSELFLNDEINFIKDILCNLGYPLDTVNSVIPSKVEEFRSADLYTVKKMPCLP